VSPRVRLLVVDDSDIFTSILCAAAERHPRVEVVGVAGNGIEALEAAKRLKPDVISMDVYMPVLGGVEAVARVMDEVPTPIAMVTGADSSEMAGISFRAVGAGALDVLRKPAGPVETGALLDRLALLAGVRVHRRRARATSAGVDTAVPAVAPSSASAAGAVLFTGLEVPAGRVQVVGIAISTGGPPVLEAALKELPRDYPVPLLIVQHLSPGFEAHLAEWLGRTSGPRVRVAETGMPAERGTAYLAPQDRHLTILREGILGVDGSPERVAGHRPSGTVLLRSLARIYGSRAAGVVMTGMGSDGAEGLLELRRAGGITAAQDAASSTVDGMPRVARENGAAQHVLRAADLGRFLRQVVAR
jgi:two-component system, chemotaxis family, protein-glutamate methylesterase/glutaminase